MKFLKKLVFVKAAILSLAILMLAVSCGSDDSASGKSDASKVSNGSYSAENSEDAASGEESGDDVGETGNTGSAGASNSNKSGSAKSGSTTSGRITGGGGGKISTEGKTYDISGQVKDLKGRKVVLQLYKDLDVGPNDKHMSRLNDRIKAVEQQYNCKIEINYTNDLDDGNAVKNSVLAGNPIVDIVTMHFSRWLQYYVAGLIQPLDDLKCIDFNDKSKFGTPAKDILNPINETMVVDGKYYGVSMANGGLHSSVQFDQMMFYRYDVLKKSGVTDNMMPDALVKANQWTWSNFEKICKTVKDAGNTPVYDPPVDTSGQQVNFYQSMLYSYGTDYLVQDPKTNRITFNGGSEKALKALTHYSDLVKKGYIEAPSPAQFKVNPNNATAVDYIAFQPGILTAAKWFWPRWGTVASKANWGMTYLPKVNASDPYAVVSSKFSENCSAIPYGVKKPAEVATIMQALSPLDTDYTAQKEETIMDFQLWLPSNANTSASTLRILREVNEISYTSAQKYTITDYAIGPGVANEWLAQVQKIATGQAEAGPTITSITGNYNDKLKNLYTIR